MTEGIIIALITGVFSLIGCAVGAYYSQGKTLYRIDQLEKKQDKHNELIERMFIVEDRCNVLDEKVKVANHRLDDLEKVAAAH